MRTFAERLRSFPVLVSLIAAAAAAVSGLLAPDTLIPSNLPQAGLFGSILVIICFLALWAFGPPLLRVRGWVVGGLIVVALVAMAGLISINQRHVVVVEVGDPPEDLRYLIGSELTERGVLWDRRLNHPPLPDYVARIGPDRIPEAWGESFVQQANTFAAAYLALAASLGLMLGLVGLSDTETETA